MDWKLSELREERGSAAPTVTPAVGWTGTAGWACGGPEPQLGNLDWNPNAKGSNRGFPGPGGCLSHKTLLMRQNAARAQIISEDLGCVSCVLNRMLAYHSAVLC